MDFKIRKESTSPTKELYTVQRISSVTGETLFCVKCLPVEEVKEWYAFFLEQCAKSHKGYVAVFRQEEDGPRFVHPSRFGWK